MIPSQIARSPDVEALARRAREGDLAAFEALYRALAGQVFGVCLRMARDRGQAEEWAQDAWVRAWEGLGSFRGEAAFSTWLHRLTVNLILDRKRSEVRWNDRFTSEESLSGIALRSGREDTPGVGVDLERALATLPEGARTVFLLHDVEGYKHREIATLLGVAVGTAKAQLHRARTLLREALNR